MGAGEEVVLAGFDDVVDTATAVELVAEVAEGPVSSSKILESPTAPSTATVSAAATRIRVGMRWRRPVT